MGIHADDLRDQEEEFADMRAAHKAGLCHRLGDFCPFCYRNWEYILHRINTMKM